MTALGKQEGGQHYRGYKIQPVEYIVANGIGFLAGNVIKYVTRYKDKGGAADIRKAIHYLELILEFEYPNVVNSANDHRADQEGRNAQGLGQEAQRAYHSGRYPQGGFEGTTGGQARELRADGKETL